jgi:hypothetical protein
MSRRGRRTAADSISAEERGTLVGNVNSQAVTNLDNPLAPLGKGTLAPPHPRKYSKLKDEAFQLPDPARSPIPPGYLLSHQTVGEEGGVRRLGSLLWCWQF